MIWINDYIIRVRNSFWDGIIHSPIKELLCLHWLMPVLDNGFSMILILHINRLSRMVRLHVDFWTPENQGAKFPRPGIASQNDMPALAFEKASFFKIREMTLGYTFPTICHK